MCALKLPKGCPPIPRGWVFKGFEWKSADPVHYACWKPGDTDGWGNLEIPAQCTGDSPGYYYITKPAKKQAQKPARREPRVSRIATIIQRAISGQLTNAMEGAHEVERIIDNAMRKKRHAKAKKEGAK